MYLDFSKLPSQANGNYEAPELLLETLDGRALGTIAGVTNLKLRIKFVEQSEMEFDVPSVIDGKENPTYELLTAYKLIYTKSYGIYVTSKPKKTSNGIMESKHITAYSIEKLMEKKKFFLEEGVYKFCNITNVKDTSTIIGRILEVDPTWNIGYVSPSIASKYGAFEQYDAELLNFIQNNAMQKYRCVFVFDPYGTPEKPGKTISVYDADEATGTLPIYLGFDNLLIETDVEELSDEMTTAIRPYGADEMSIRDVNPAGDDWVYDLSGFIARGDISGELAEAFTSWQKRVLNNKAYYSALTAARASMWSRYYTESAKLTALQGELDGLMTQQNAAIQGQHASALNSLYYQIENKRREMDAQKAVIAQLEQNRDNIAQAIDKLINGSGSTKGLALRKALTEEQYNALLPYIIQQDVTDDTFVVSELATDMSPTAHALNGASVGITGAKIDRVSLTSGFNCTMYTIVGGSFAASNARADIIRGTLEVDGGSTFTLSLYTGTITVGSSSADDGIITISGTISGSVASDITTRNNNGVVTYEGTYLRFTTSSANLFLSASAGEFQKWAVEEQLYEYAVELLDDFATPTYQFTVQSGNFLFAKEFEPFRNKLELGKGVYLNLPGEQTITPYIVEIDLNFENASDFTLLFSNRFKRKDEVSTLKEMIEKTYSTSRNLDLSKHTYNTAASEATDAAKFIRESLDFAANRIKSATNQSVVIDSAGIQIGEASNPNQMRIVSDMLAITNDGWKTAKLAIGYFQNASGANYFGVNAQVIAGNLIIGTELHIDTAKGHFKVDNDGVYVNGMKFYVLHGGTTQTLNDEFDGIVNKANHDLFSALNGLNDFDLDPNVAIFYEPADPRTAAGGSHSVATNDVWYLTADNVYVRNGYYNSGTIFQWKGSYWLKVENSDLRTALDNAKAAQDTADGKVMFFKLNRVPTASDGFDSAHGTGDLWYNTRTTAFTSGGVTYKPLKLYRYSGSVWEEITDGSLKTEIEDKYDAEIKKFFDNGYLDSTKLKGVISAQQAQMKSSKGNVLFDSDGIWLMNGTTKANTTQAVWMNEKGILFGTGSKTSDPGASNSGWKWTTAINHQGIVADALAGKTVSGLKLYGGELHIGDKGNGTYYFNVDKNGNLNINDQFKVDNQGNVTANKGTFKGSLDAATVKGTLKADATYGGWLEGCGIRVGVNSRKTNGYNFYVDSSGNVWLNGTIHMEGGSITWGSGNSPVRVLYSPYASYTPYLPYDSYPASSYNGWHKNMNSLDLYASYTYDGGNTWTSAVKIVGEDGRDGQNGSDANVNDVNVFNALTSNGSKFGCFYSYRGGLYINASYLQTGTLNADYISLACGSGGFTAGSGSTDRKTTYGAKMYGSNGPSRTPYIIVTDAGCRLEADGANFWVAGSSVHSSTEIAIGSDRRIKNSISYDVDKYDEFFMALKPAFYRMNSGTSKRFHTGFIAQDVEQALHESGLTNSDFAGLTIEKLDKDSKVDQLEDECYMLRYSSFVSLNTHMIQKLYRRIDKLERELEQLRKGD